MYMPVILAASRTLMPPRPMALAISPKLSWSRSLLSFSPESRFMRITAAFFSASIVTCGRNRASQRQTTSVWRLHFEPHRRLHFEPHMRLHFEPHRRLHFEPHRRLRFEPHMRLHFEPHRKLGEDSAYSRQLSPLVGW
eukprot:2538510-Pyramimonas_sp.AAC.1